METQGGQIFLFHAINLWLIPILAKALLKSNDARKISWKSSDRAGRVQDTDGTQPQLCLGLLQNKARYF